jgi:hypothetical protein
MRRLRHQSPFLRSARVLPTGAPGKCFIADLPGKCAYKPEICILHKGVFFIPECGCNGVTYSNDCERRKAGVSLAHKGKC